MSCLSTAARLSVFEVSLCESLPLCACVFLPPRLALGLRCCGKPGLDNLAAVGSSNTKNLKFVFSSIKWTTALQAGLQGGGEDPRETRPVHALLRRLQRPLLWLHRGECRKGATGVCAWGGGGGAKKRGM